MVGKKRVLGWRVEVGGAVVEGEAEVRHIAGLAGASRELRINGFAVDRSLAVAFLRGDVSLRDVVDGGYRYTAYLNVFADEPPEIIKTLFPELLNGEWEVWIENAVLDKNKDIVSGVLCARRMVKRETIEKKEKLKKLEVEHWIDVCTPIRKGKGILRRGEGRVVYRVRILHYLNKTPISKKTKVVKTLKTEVTDKPRIKLEKDKVVIEGTKTEKEKNKVIIPLVKLVEP